MAATSRSVLIPHKALFLTAIPPPTTISLIPPLPALVVLAADGGRVLRLPAGPTNALKLLKTVPAPPTRSESTPSWRSWTSRTGDTAAPGTPNSPPGLVPRAPGSSVPDCDRQGAGGGCKGGPGDSVSEAAAAASCAGLAAESRPGRDQRTRTLDSTPPGSIPRAGGEGRGRPQGQGRGRGMGARVGMGGTKRPARRSSEPVQPRQVVTQVGLTRVELFLDAAGWRGCFSPGGQASSASKRS